MRRGGGGGGGGGLVELDERGEPGLENSSNSVSIISSGRAFHWGMVRGKNDICLYQVLLRRMS